MRQFETMLRFFSSTMQKYRMYLKKISNGNGQQNMLGRSALDAMGFSRGRYPNSLLSGYPPSLGEIFGGRLSSGKGLSVSSISSSDLIQSGQNLRNSISPHAKLQPHGLPSFPNGGLLQGMGHLGDFKTGFGVTDNFVDQKVMMVNGSNGNNNNSLVLSGPSQFSQTSQSPVLGALAGPSSGGFVEKNETPESWKALVQNPESSFQLGDIQQQLVGFSQMSVSGDLTNVFESLNPLGTLGMEPSSLGANGDSFIGQVHGTATQDDLIPSTIESMADIVNSMTRPDNNGSASMFINGEFNFDDYSPAAGL